VLDVSVPWSVDPNVTYRDHLEPVGEMDRLPVLVRDYETPSGPLRHAVRQTGEDPGPGWVVQPDHVPMIRYLYAPPAGSARRWFDERMEKVKAFADQHGVAVQAWSGFGTDGVV
jgi:hypothetical protein